MGYSICEQKPNTEHTCISGCPPRPLPPVLVELSDTPSQFTPIGWQCPVCKRVYAPHVECCECDTENVNVSEWLDDDGELKRSE